MVRVLDRRDRPVRLSAAQERAARIRLARRERANPLRRVLLECETRYQRDAVAAVGDHVWCDVHGDFARVVRVVQ
jgi:hypothetical protein